MENSKENFIIAIDGEAGTGKSTHAKNLAKKLDITYIDTGAMYRCVTLACLEKGVEPDNYDGVDTVLKDIKIEFKREDGIDKVFLNGSEVTSQIRTPRVDSYVAKFAALKNVREKMTPLQREMGKVQSVIMEGRDIGTVVFPNAQVKIYLDCSEEERAMRRYKQNLEKGINSSYEDVLKNIKERHKLETQREIAPLVKAEDAVLIDTTNYTLEETEDMIMKIIKEKIDV